MLNENIHRYLFSKGTLIGEKRSEHAFAARFALASIFNISITSGQESLTITMRFRTAYARIRRFVFYWISEIVNL